jgi:hypothetical protein
MSGVFHAWRISHALAQNRNVPVSRFLQYFRLSDMSLTLRMTRSVFLSLPLHFFAPVGHPG